MFGYRPSANQLGGTVTLHGYSTFLPTIISGLRYSAIQAQLTTRHSLLCLRCHSILHCRDLVRQNRSTWNFCSCSMSSLGSRLLRASKNMEIRIRCAVYWIHHCRYRIVFRCRNPYHLDAEQSSHTLQTRNWTGNMRVDSFTLFSREEGG